VKDGPVQTRSEQGDHIRYFDSVNDALSYATSNLDVWKVSWKDLDGKRVRLVKEIIFVEADDNFQALWKYEPMEDEIKTVLEETRGD
jgi:hypothetical protein